jgi:hypothetical protein
LGSFFLKGSSVSSSVNYLIPTDADIQAEDEVRYRAVDAGLILDKMQTAANSLNIVILDACRDNPFARSFRSTSRGLAHMDPPSGSLIVYATSPGKVADDGSGRNGVFTRHFLEKMKVPGLEVREMLSEVRVAVEKETGGKQTPWELSSLRGKFFFSPEAPRVSTTSSLSVPSSSAPQLDAEAEAWRYVKDSNKPQDLKNFLELFPGGKFVPVAKLRLKQLEDAQQGAAATQMAGGTTVIEKPKPPESPKAGSLRVDTNPPGAAVAVEGVGVKQKGVSPLSLGDLAPGKLKVRVTLDHYEARERDVEIVAGRNTDVSFILDRVPSSVKPSAESTSAPYQAATGSGGKHGPFIKYADGTVLDTRTNLMWMTKDFRVIEGRFLQNESWYEAMAWAKKINSQGYAGFTDWYVPSISEYLTLCKTPQDRKFYTQVFEDFGADYFWSRKEPSKYIASYIDFRDSAATSGNKEGQNALWKTSFSFSVRLVRNAK